MDFQPQNLLNHQFKDIHHSYNERDAILYALGLGLGSDPTDTNDLEYLIETNLKVLPSMAVTLSSPGMWIKEPQFGVDFTKLVHAEQHAWFHAPLPPKAEVTGSAKVLSLRDRGAKGGALIVLERIIQDATTDVKYCTLHQTLMLRGDGDFGGIKPKKKPSNIPERAPDYKVNINISSRAALIYRLSGDLNPLHADPAFAKKAGFERPILQGLASYGIASVAITKAVGCSPQKITELGCRFTGIIYPGDEISFHIWQEGHILHFQAYVADRKVLDQGIVAIKD